MYFITVAVVVCVGLVCGYAASPPPAAGGSGNCQAKMTADPIDPSSKCCTAVGKGDNAIDQHPWAALVDFEIKKTKALQTMCAGTLISGKYVLTAGYCIAGPVLDTATPVAVRLGEFDLSHEGKDCVPVTGGGEDCNDGATIIAIETTIPHPKYVPGPSKSNDIGLIRLKEVAPYTDFIRPICLPTKNLESNPPDHPLSAVTWYNPQHKNLKLKTLIKVPFVNQEKCSQIYSSRKTVLGQGQLCAGGIEGMDTCRGDGGGPLVYENQGISELAGISSFGRTPCGQKDIPSVYTNVYEHLDWIKSIIVA